MIGSRGGPGGVAAASKDFLLDLVVQMIRKHDKIKQKRRNRACPKMNSILFFSNDISI